MHMATHKHACRCAVLPGWGSKPLTQREIAKEKYEEVNAEQLRKALGRTATEESAADKVSRYIHKIKSGTQIVQGTSPPPFCSWLRLILFLQTI